MNSNTKYPHGQNQIPFEDVPVGAPFIDSEFGGVWIKRLVDGNDSTPMCLEDGSAYTIGDSFFFNPNQPVYLCTRGKDGWVELFPAKELTRNEASLLLFFETQMVDYGGLLQGCRMNADDYAIAKRWHEEKFIQYGRINSADIPAGPMPRTNWVILSDAAWAVIARERRARADRKAAAITITRNGYEAAKG